MPITPALTSQNSESRPWWPAFCRGLRLLCPRCGDGPLFFKYLKISPCCSKCGLELDSYRTDDAPPYFTILLVGHLIVPAVLLLEHAAHPPEWIHLVLWAPLTILLTLALLPRVKGALVGWQWSTAVKA
ncbi:MAG: DUF983 domain-containing protein [Proteobacteria bacterium]|nr:DUF983 domain-containing protein [Pseudomonadota bacterium]